MANRANGENLNRLDPFTEDWQLAIDHHLAIDHDLRIERGRYCRNYTDPTSRICRSCSKNSDDTMTIFTNLPFCKDFMVETEKHAKTKCPAYHHLRITLSDNLKSLIMLKEYGAIMSTHHMKEFGRYLFECHRLRNPRTKGSQRSDIGPSVED